MPLEAIGSGQVDLAVPARAKEACTNSASESTSPRLPHESIFFSQSRLKNFERTSAQIHHANMQLFPPHNQS